MNIEKTTIKVEPEEINAFVLSSLFKTEEMRKFWLKVQNEESFISSVIREFLKYPRIFTKSHQIEDFSDIMENFGNLDINSKNILEYSKYEESHPYYWMNIIYLNDYNIPDAANDVCYLRKIFHVATLTYEPNINWVDWYEKIGMSETEASFLEVFIYARLPRSFREKSFKFKIWPDIVYEEAKLKEIDDIESESFYNFVYDKTINTIISPNPYLFHELKLSNSASMHFNRSVIWRKNYSKIENMMSDFMISIDNSSSYEEKKKATLNYLKNLYSSNCSYSIPFFNEAEKFYQIHNKNNELFGDYLIQQKQSEK